MNKRKLRLKDYGISPYRYMELHSFCMQYPEWRRELEHKTDTVKSPSADGMPKYGEISDGTARLAIQRAILESKCRIIEQTALEAGEDLKEYIIKSVCYGKSVRYLIGTLGMPCNERSFYDYRRYFFYLLDKKR